ncbi:MAG: phosphoribosylaminoimidazolesuccinocarboxamide synthase [Candidatus Dadabacteria bacterium]|nr:MAG: phosphoribosylaminoimidazolesuccinocarboxamide synthase [Candidatus Dadabacteria bacterium]
MAALEEVVREQLKKCLSSTNLALGEKIVGKVRDNYIDKDKQVRYVITTDRISCFDVVVGTIPFKGKVLTDLAVYWLEKTKDIAENHLIDMPCDCVMICKECEVLPVEVVIRGYLAGSAWRDYKAGRDISGIKLPEGLKEWQKLSSPILTPSTKASKGEHDMPISEKEIIERKIVDKKIWEEVREKAFALFSFGQEEAEKRGLILVDTKYEFGIYKGKVLLVDEVHTLDSSRYWIASTYQERLNRGEPPEMLDKEQVRRWLREQGFSGEGEPPILPDEFRVQTALSYINSYELITGKVFEGKVKDFNEEIAKVLSRDFAL